MSVLDVLKSAHALYLHHPATPALHTLGLAYDHDGQHVRPDSPDAETFTSVGAVGRVAKTSNPLHWMGLTNAGEEACRLLEIAAAQQGYGSPVLVDLAGPEAVAQMWARAVQLAPEDRASTRETR